VNVLETLTEHRLGDVQVPRLRSDGMEVELDVIAVGNALVNALSEGICTER
jgi:hypothetical protein